MSGPPPGRRRLRGRGFARPFQEFFRLESAGGIVLLVSAVAALAWANSPFSSSYFELWATTVSVEVGALSISKPLLLWINDGLMAIFFLVVGLEIKREVMVGELADPRKARLAIAAALGGMLVPAGLYAALNVGGPGAPGWGIPMATDIAFALGVLALLGRRVPMALVVFVTAVAIVDDLGAVLVIAVFYTAKISLPALAAAGVFLVALLLANRLGIRRTWPYVILGIGLWVAFLKSGMHATIAGVLLALAIPSQRQVDAPVYLERSEALLDEFREDMVPGEREPSKDQLHVLHALGAAARQLEPPLQRIEHALHPWVAFFIVPVFALANAGVVLTGGLSQAAASPVTVGVVLGLVVGKQVGILVFAWAAVKGGLASLPRDVSWSQVWGVSLLCGIGFTMSLFIASLGLSDPLLLEQAKIGILAGSFLAGVGGAIVLARGGRGSVK